MKMQFLSALSEKILFARNRSFSTLASTMTMSITLYKDITYKNHRIIGVLLNPYKRSIKIRKKERRNNQ